MKTVKMQEVKKSQNTVENDDNDYKKFINNIAGGETLPFETLIGYLLSEFDSNINNRMIIILGSAASGKGLFTQGISHLREIAFLNGRDLNYKNDPFLFKSMTSTASILHIDDLPQSFDFEKSYYNVTDGFVINEKRKEEIRRIRKETIKTLISTNHPIRENTISYECRAFKLMLSDHYGIAHKPIDEFGHQLFHNWDKDHWNRFENYLQNCIQKYLEHGLVEQRITESMEKENFITNTSQ